MNTFIQSEHTANLAIYILSYIHIYNLIHLSVLYINLNMKVFLHVFPIIFRSHKV